MAELKPLLFLFGMLVISGVGARQVAVKVNRSFTNKSSVGAFVAGLMFVTSFLLFLFVGVLVLGSLFVFER